MKKLLSLLDSKKFLWAILVIFFLQALWIACSFRYPLIYDEIRHVPIIQAFADGVSPFVSSQPEIYDSLGSLNLFHGFTASWYHYLMSFPYSIISLLTESFSYQVIFLRIINIVMFTAGIFLFSQLFTKIGIKRRYTNISLLTFSLLPITPFVAAHINYDNLSFVLTPLFLILSVDILQQRKIKWITVLSLIITGCAASLVKYTFIPIFAVSIIGIVFLLYRRHRSTRSIINHIEPIGELRKKKTLVTAAVAILLSGIFAYTFIGNLTTYHRLRPSCEQVLSIDRCLSNSVAKRNISAQETADQRPLLPFYAYYNQWYLNMVRYTTWSAYALETPRYYGTPVMLNLIYFGPLLAVSIVLLGWKRIRYNSTIKLILVVSLFLTLMVFYSNFSSYIKLHQIYATQPRYILPIVPVFLVISALSLSRIINSSKLKAALLLCLALILTQGGGVITHILYSQPSWYWDNHQIRVVNSKLQSLVKPFVNER